MRSKRIILQILDLNTASVLPTKFCLHRDTENIRQVCLAPVQSSSPSFAPCKSRKLVIQLRRLAKLGFHYVGERKVFDSCCNAGIPDFYSPVCGSDGKTYDNEWEMDYFACEGKNYVTKVDIKNCPDWVDPNSLYPPEFWASWGKN
ncbi:hypothetical protein RRG08_055973 [Elysia crispata]|uniref:Kazal-like domain-containing protein n=1 Tax=Elysia crispata TaxID=231223 RepID=A0AAE1AG82_9GAST|nr:hypothetical protein RRG08_055973 [Elysia crispata]